MRPRPFVSSLVVALCAVLLPVVPAAASTWSCPAGTGPLPFAVTTGIDANGSAIAQYVPDPKWRVVQTPASTTPTPAYGAQHPAWYYPGPAASWVQHSPGGAWQVGTIVFELEFSLASSRHAGPLAFAYAADNGVTFSLNGTPIGGYLPGPSDPPAFGTTRGIALAAPPYVAGVNRLRAEVRNDSAWDGLFVEGGMDVCDTRSTCQAYGVLVAPDPGLGLPPLGVAAATVRPSVTGVRPPGPMARPAAPVVSQDDAVFDELVSGLSTDVYAKEAYASCAVARNHRDAWGSAGASNVRIVTALGPGLAIEVPMAELEAEIWVGDAGGQRDLACRASLIVDGRTHHNACEYLSVDGVAVKVETGVSWGPVLRADGLTHWGGAAVHVFVDMPSGQDQHVWIGWVDVATVVSPPAYPPVS